MFSLNLALSSLLLWTENEKNLCRKFHIEARDIATSPCLLWYEQLRLLDVGQFQSNDSDLLDVQPSSRHQLCQSEKLFDKQSTVSIF